MWKSTKSSCHRKFGNYATLILNGLSFCCKRMCSLLLTFVFFFPADWSRIINWHWVCHSYCLPAECCHKEVCMCVCMCPCHVLLDECAGLVQLCERWLQLTFIKWFFLLLRVPDSVLQTQFSAVCKDVCSVLSVYQASGSTSLLKSVS